MTWATAIAALASTGIIITIAGGKNNHSRSKSNKVILLMFFIFWNSKLKLFYKQYSMLFTVKREKLT